MLTIRGAPVLSTRAPNDPTSTALWMTTVRASSQARAAIPCRRVASETQTTAVVSGRMSRSSQR
jgi:hypothetical protein